MCKGPSTKELVDQIAAAKAKLEAQRAAADEAIKMLENEQRRVEAELSAEVGTSKFGRAPTVSRSVCCEADPSERFPAADRERSQSARCARVDGDNKVLVYGREDLERIVRSGQSEWEKVLQVPIDIDTDDLEMLIAAVMTVHGRHDYVAHPEKNEVTRFLDEFLAEAIKPQWDAIEPIIDTGEIAVVVWNLDVQSSKAANMIGWDGKTSVFPMTQAVRRKMAAGCASLGDDITGRWLTGKCGKRIFAMTRLGTLLVNYADGLGFSVQPASTSEPIPSRAMRLSRPTRTMRPSRPIVVGRRFRRR